MSRSFLFLRPTLSIIAFYFCATYKTKTKKTKQKKQAFGFITVFVTVGQMWFIFKEFRDTKSGAGGDANTTTTTTTTTVVTEQYDAPTADA